MYNTTDHWSHRGLIRSIRDLTAIQNLSICKYILSVYTHICKYQIIYVRISCPELFPAREAEKSYFLNGSAIKAFPAPPPRA